jgi:hypothetical protein
VDHESGERRLDLQHAWDNQATPAPITPLDELVCDPDAGWLCSELGAEGGAGTGVKWHQVGARGLAPAGATTC